MLCWKWLEIYLCFATVNLLLCFFGVGWFLFTKLPVYSFRSCVYKCTHQGNALRATSPMKICLRHIYIRHIETLLIGPALQVRIISVKYFSKIIWNVNSPLWHALCSGFTSFTVFYYVLCEAYYSSDWIGAFQICYTWNIWPHMRHSSLAFSRGIQIPWT